MEHALLDHATMVEYFSSKASQLGSSLSQEGRRTPARQWLHVGLLIGGCAALGACAQVIQDELSDPALDGTRPLGLGFGDGVSGQLWGTVFLDADRDGSAADAGTVLLEGFQVELWQLDSADQPARFTGRRAQTDAHGAYFFGDLSPAFAYEIRFEKRAGYAFTQANSPAAPNDNLDSDVDPQTGHTPPLDPAPLEEQFAHSAGVYLAQDELSDSACTGDCDEDMDGDELGSGEPAKVAKTCPDGGVLRQDGTCFIAGEQNCSCPANVNGNVVGDRCEFSTALTPVAWPNCPVPGSFMFPGSLNNACAVRINIEETEEALPTCKTFTFENVVLAQNFTVRGVRIGLARVWCGHVSQKSPAYIMYLNTAGGSVACEPTDTSVTYPALCPADTQAISPTLCSY